MEHVGFAKKIAESKGGTFLRSFRKDRRWWIEVRCSEGHQWNTQAYRVSKYGNWCKSCSSVEGAKRRYPIFLRKAQKLAEEKGGKLLSNEYKPNKKLEWQCAEGHVWKTKLNSVSIGYWCHKCAYIKIGLNDSRRLNIKIMKKWAAKFDGEYLDLEYKNIRKPARWRCAKGHEFSRPPGQVRAGNWCRRCVYNTDRIEQEFYDVVYEKGGKIISGEYKNAYSEFIIECSEGHQWETYPHSVKGGDVWCRRCSLNINEREVELAEYVWIRGGKVIAGELNNTNSYMTIKCKNGHIWDCTFHNLVKHNSWCKQCSSYLNEKRIRKIFESLFDSKFPSKKPNWLLNKSGNRLELDGYNSELGIAFEYNGEQHYRVIHYFHKGKQTLQKQQEHDKIKLEICESQGVILVVIPFTVKIKKMYEFVVNELDKHGITPHNYTSNFNWRTLLSSI